MRNLFIKHNKYKDVFCLVLKSFELPDKYKLKIEWYNSNYQIPRSMGFIQNTVLYKSDLKNWHWTNQTDLSNIIWNEFK